MRLIHLCHHAGTHRRRAVDRGQAAVEFAVVLPLVVVLVFCIVQVALVVRDQIAVELAAREGARAASVAASPSGAARSAAEHATGLTPIDVSTSVSATRVAVTVRHTTHGRLPIVGGAIGNVELSATVEMQREPP